MSGGEGQSRTAIGGLLMGWNSNVWNTVALIFLGFVSLATKEVVTFVMLGFVIIILSNIYNVLKEISRKLDR